MQQSTATSTANLDDSNKRRKCNYTPQRGNYNNKLPERNDQASNATLPQYTTLPRSTPHYTAMGRLQLSISATSSRPSTCSLPSLVSGLRLPSLLTSL